MSIDVYEQIPVMDSEKFLLREIEDGDAEDLFKVYSDKDAVPLFNSDNCVNGFCYTSIKEMKHTISFWKREYQSRYYVRWAIIDKNANCAIGTIELFNRRAKDYFNNCGLLRLDLRSDYEKQDTIEDILGIIIPETRDLAESIFFSSTRILPSSSAANAGSDPFVRMVTFLARGSKTLASCKA
mgnify:CR=1 FL=1